MFEAAELGSKISKEEYKAQVPALRAALLEAQQELRAAPFRVIVVFAGVDGAGKGETVNLLHEWMDPRWIATRAYGEPSDEECERPEFWRYWRDLPSRGCIGLFLSSWYSRPVVERVNRAIGTAEFESQLDQIAAFEKGLADDGAIILKFWMHLGKAAQRKRLRAFEKDPLRRWRVTKQQWKNWKLYDRFVAAAERAIRWTSTGQAPWRIVEGADESYRTVTVGVTLRDAIRQGLARTRNGARPAVTEEEHGKSAKTSTDSVGGALGKVAKQYNVLARLDMSRKIDRTAFRIELEKQQGRLNRLQRKARNQGVSTLVVFEGWDASGKGGAIRRVTAALDARDYRVIPIAAPTDEERAHHYLWRFWRHLSRAGRMTVFDRSWYGRMLVERVEGFATPEECMRAYVEINQFEEQLVNHGIVLVKFWIHVTKSEQLRRFRDRESTPHKRWKITQDDWRNRRKWDQYARAVNEMVERTSTHQAPWTLVEGNDKNSTRIKVLKTLGDRISDQMKG